MAELYERFPMLADKRRAAARTLSGGQRQILAMAIALMNAPDLLLLDEPTAGLSPRAAEELFGTILALNQVGRGDPDGRAECAGGAGGVGTRLCAGAGPGGARGAGPPTSRTIPPSAISFSAARRSLCSGGHRGFFERRNGELQHEQNPDRPPRRAGGRRRRRGRPGRRARPGRPDQARHADAAHRRRRLLRAVDGQGRRRGGRGGQQGGRRARPAHRAGQRGRPDQSRGRRARGAQADRRRQGRRPSWAPGPRR